LKITSYIKYIQIILPHHRQEKKVCNDESSCVVDQIDNQESNTIKVASNLEDLSISLEKSDNQQEKLTDSSINAEKYSDPVKSLWNDSFLLAGNKTLDTQRRELFYKSIIKNDSPLRINNTATISSGELLKSADEVRSGEIVTGSFPSPMKRLKLSEKITEMLPTSETLGNRIKFLTAVPDMLTSMSSIIDKLAGENNPVGKFLDVEDVSKVYSPNINNTVIKNPLSSEKMCTGNSLTLSERRVDEFFEKESGGDCLMNNFVQSSIQESDTIEGFKFSDKDQNPFLSQNSLQEEKQLNIPFVTSSVSESQVLTAIEKCNSLEKTQTPSNTFKRPKAPNEEFVQSSNIFSLEESFGEFGFKKRKRLVGDFESNQMYIVKNMIQDEIRMLYDFGFIFDNVEW
jgi:hypothetical protein